MKRTLRLQTAVRELDLHEVIPVAPLFPHCADWLA
jgi:hypothetical protein